MIRCLDADSWYEAASGKSNSMLTRHWVPPFIMFRVYVGKRGCPDLVDGRTRFLCLGSRRLGLGCWLTKVRIVGKHRLYNKRYKETLTHV